MTFPRQPLDSPELLTFQDAVDRLQLALGLRGSDHELNVVRMAVIDAMRELPARHDWAYYKRVLQIATQAPTTGLVGAYDHTGGANERQVTLATGTWPANAADGQVLFGDNLYRLEKRVSDTVAVLSYDSNPGADVSSTGMTWVKTSYEIGQRIRRLRSLTEANTDLPLDYMTQADLAEYLRATPQPSQPVFYNIHQTGNYLATMEVEFAPPPYDSRVYLLSIEAQPRPLRTHADAFTVTNSGATVTSSDNAFKSYHVGSVIRLSNSTTAPTGYSGKFDSYNPFAEQRIITSVNSTTEVTVNSAFDRTWTGVAAIVTDPLDLDPVGTFDYFMALCMRKFAQYSPAGGNLEKYVAIERQALGSAVASDPYIHTDLMSPTRRLGMSDMEYILSFPVTE